MGDVRDGRRVIVVATGVAPSHSIALALGDVLHTSPNMYGRPGLCPFGHFSGSPYL